MSKLKIINDPVLGFISISKEDVFKLIEHSWFQRLRRIKQLGLTHMVYPGALHTRFAHAIGAYHLLLTALETLQAKGVEVSPKDKLDTAIAALLHDLGHGPFSHALESYFIRDACHEKVGLLLMERIGNSVGVDTSGAIELYNSKSKPYFLKQLISSQLDVDRLDYLLRDSFYTGVIEGRIGSSRIIRMMDVHDGELVIEAKGILSIEQFLMARRLMYWQVYLHKAVVAAEQLLLKILQRARVVGNNVALAHVLPDLVKFIDTAITYKDLEENEEHIQSFAQLDDTDILAAIKYWRKAGEKVLADLTSQLLERRLPKVVFMNRKPDEDLLEKLKDRTISQLNIAPEDATFYFWSGEFDLSTYTSASIAIRLMTNEGEKQELTEKVNQSVISSLIGQDTRYFICMPKSVSALV